MEHIEGFRKELPGHTSAETAYIVEDYPYGFRLRTKIRYWVETTKYGQRGVSQTLNPKTGKWNKPRASTYSDIVVMGLDELGHVAYDGLHTGCSEEDCARFESVYALDDYQKKKINLMKGIARGLSKLNWTVHKVTPEDPGQPVEERRDIVKKACLIGLSEVMEEQGLTRRDVI